MSKGHFNFKVSGSLIFGNQSSSQLPQVLEDLSIKSVCIVTDRGVSGTGSYRLMEMAIMGRQETPWL